MYRDQQAIDLKEVGFAYVSLVYEIWEVRECVNRNVRLWTERNMVAKEQKTANTMDVEDVLPKSQRAPFSVADVERASSIQPDNSLSLKRLINSAVADPRPSWAQFDFRHLR